MKSHEVEMDYKNRSDYRVLFVTKTSRVDAPYLDPSVRYRCFNPAEALLERGVVADVISQDKLDAAYVANYDAFVFHRPDPVFMSMSLFVKLAKSKGKAVIADYDDLIFNPEYALKSSLFLNGGASKDKVREIFWRNYKAFRLFDFFSVSTSPLAEQVLSLNPKAKVAVVPNGLSRSMLGSYKQPVHKKDNAFGGYKVFSYLSGTASHAPDIAFIGDVLADLLSSRKNVRIAIAGPVKLPDSLTNSPGILRIPYREFFDFFPSAAGFYANIAPLAAGNVFNNCKSALKFFESGIWGVPTVASPIEDFKRFADSPGLVLAETPEDWSSALEAVLDEDRHRNMVAGLREYCLEHCMADGPAEVLLSFLKEIC